MILPLPAALLLAAVVVAVFLRWGCGPEASPVDKAGSQGEPRQPDPPRAGARRHTTTKETP